MVSRTVFLGLGSNQGDRAALIGRACSELASFLSGFRSSSLYETAPMYMIDQPLFLNCVVTGQAVLDPFALLAEIHRIEDKMGRDRQAAGWKGPRPIDVDILLYGDWTLRTDHLTVPHPLMTERKFVLVPLLELEPDICEPGSKRPYHALLAALGEQGIYYYSLNRYSRFHGEADGGTGEVSP